MDRVHVIQDAADRTCEWLTTHPNYKCWLRARSSLLWVKGKPGAGKSTLMKYAIRQNNHAQARISWFFFNARGSPIEKSPRGLYQSLLYQLLPHTPGQLSKLSLIYEERNNTRGDFGTKWSWRDGELREWLTAVLLTPVTKSNRIYVDALDEAGEEVAVELVQYFQSLLSRSRQSNISLHVCFSCRHYPIISLCNGLEICVEVENPTDIENYVRGRFELINVANGAFQWIVLIVPQVIWQCRKGVPLRTIQHNIRRLPQELHDLYREILGSIPDDERPYSLRLMRWICFALRPLSVREMRFAIVMDPDAPYHSLRECASSVAYVDTDEDMERRIIDLSGGLAEVIPGDDRKIIQLVHQSVSDYLVQGGIQLLENRPSGNVLARAHLELSWSCAWCLCMDEFRVIHNAKSRSVLENIHLKDTLCEKCPLILYAIESWIPHAVHAEKHHAPEKDLLRLFQTSCKWLQQWIKLFLISGLSKRENDYPNGVTVFHIVARFGLSSTLSTFLTTNNSEVDATDSYGRTPLSHAAENSHEAVVRLLLNSKNININSKDDEGWTPLSRAVAYEKEAVVRLLLSRRDIDINSEDKYGKTPLHLAAIGKNEVIVELLLTHKGIDINPKDVTGQTPLFFAVKNSNETTERLLLRHKDIDINSKDKYGRTALFHAAGLENEELARLLLAHKGINVNAEDRHGKTPLFQAVEFGSEKVIRLLLAHKDINVNARNRYMQTPLYDAVRLGRKKAIRLLLACKDININAKDRDGRTPLFHAVRCRNVEVVRLLLTCKNIEVNSKDCSGQTALWIAVYNRQTDSVRLLVNHPHIDVNSEDNHGYTPLILAVIIASADDWSEDDVRIVLKILLSHPNINVD
ncbi:hypothetical protein VTN96DRAFT_760 [Rasamsonia emersonii]